MRYRIHSAAKFCEKDVILPCKTYVAGNNTYQTIISDVKTKISVVMSQISFLPISSRTNNPFYYDLSFNLARS